MNSPPTDPLHYAGFWPRLGAQLVDLLIFLPLIVFSHWGNGHYRLFKLYYAGPDTLINLLYYIYLVQRFGGTPGKLAVGVRIRKINGDMIGYREALLRCGPVLVLSVVSTLASIYARIHIDDAEFHSFTHSQLSKSEAANSPFWRWWADFNYFLWTLADFIVFCTNQKRQALHDVVAGTVVVRISPDKPLPLPAAAEA